ncbi:hypothetical protein Trydic_g23479 [Trypoxylus dichotomus]
MLTEALDPLKNGKTQRYVEPRCDIPRKTLRNRLKTDSSDRKTGRKPILNKEEQLDLEKATGICSLDKDILPVEAFSFSLPTDRLAALNEEVDSDYDADDYLP